MRRRPPARLPIVVDGPLERGITVLSGLMASGAPVPEIALAAARFADEFGDQAAKSPAERTLVSRVAGMFEAAAGLTIRKWKAEGRMVVTDPGSYLSTVEFAALVRRRPATVRRWRAAGFGPQGFLLGGRVLYRRADVESWIAAVEKSQTREEL